MAVGGRYMIKIAKMAGAIACGLLASIGWPTIAAADRPALVFTPVSHIELGDAWFYIPPDSYTRLIICEKPRDNHDCGQADKPVGADPARPIYPYRTRGWLARFLIGIGHSENLSVDVRAGRFVATVPLISLSHDSTRTGGEGFSRSVYYKAMDYPLFLVRGAGDGEVAQADVKMSATDKVTSYAAATTLSAVVAVTRALAAPPPLLTKLAVDSNRAVANSIDRTIGSLFGVSISEEQVEDQKIAAWRDVEITLSVPNEEGKWHKLKSADGGQTEQNLDYSPIGTWVLYFDYPHISAFSNEIVKCSINDDHSIGEVKDLFGVSQGSGPAACERLVNMAHNQARADVKKHYADVLDFPVIANHDNPVTIADFLRQQDWWNPGLNAISPPGAPTPDADAVDLFCREIRSTIGDLGFNTLDQYLVVAAVAQSASLSRIEGNALTTDSCIDPSSTDQADLATMSANTMAAAVKTAAPRPSLRNAAHRQRRT